MRQLLFGFLAVLLFFPLGITSVLATQDATPAAAGAAFADLGLPELSVTVTATGYEGLPESIEAGRYLVTVTVAEDVEFGGGVGFVRPPEGMTVDEFLAIHAEAGPSEVEGEVPGGTPVLEPEATPVTSAPPQEIFEATYAGGTFAMSGQSSQVVLDLSPGEWIAWADDPEAPQAPAQLTVTGEMSSDLPEPESGATLTLGEYVIGITSGELTAGQQVVRIEHLGNQPHFIFMGRVADTVTVTEADIEAVLEAEMTGTTADVDFNPEEDFMPVFGTGTQSYGTEMWVPVNLEPGTYVLVCFFPDSTDGHPHAYKGMFTLLEVGE